MIETEMPEAVRPPTVFEEKVYAALRDIPCGKVVTYGEIARRIGVKAPRAVGQALRRNPDAPSTPCHRVVRGDRSLGGYFGETEGEMIARKRGILEGEGVIFEESGRVEEGSMWDRCGIGEGP